jgi:hypothetical protein
MGPSIQSTKRYPHALSDFRRLKRKFEIISFR